MKQCILSRGNRRTVAWLPVQFAVRGKYLRLQESDGWRVDTVFSLYLEKVDIPRGYFAGGVSSTGSIGAK